MPTIHPIHRGLYGFYKRYGSLLLLAFLLAGGCSGLRFDEEKPSTPDASERSIPDTADQRETQNDQRSEAPADAGSQHEAPGPEERHAEAFGDRTGPEPDARPPREDTHRPESPEFYRQEPPADADSSDSPGTEQIPELLPDKASAEPPLQTHPISASNANILNPERGLYNWVNLMQDTDLSSVRQKGYTLSYARVLLAPYSKSALPTSFLQQLDKGFLVVRKAGIKVILRFVYNEDASGSDATAAQILAHLTQLKPTLQKHADVIALMQAGFVGAWGEWHSSTSVKTSEYGSILRAILAALPASRMVQVRTPHYKEDIFKQGAIKAQDAFSSQPYARVGHHNDCFLASDSDMGTYRTPIAQWKQLVATDGLYTPIGGETCALYAPRTDCTTAESELKMLHFDYLNAVYHDKVIAAWKQQGCFDRIQRSLGYRLELTKLQTSEKVRPGGILRVAISLANRGYSPLYNARPVFLVLSAGATRLQARLRGQDPRRWSSTVQIMSRLRIPASLPAGNYRLSFWMPDAASGFCYRRRTTCPKHRRPSHEGS